MKNIIRLFTRDKHDIPFNTFTRDKHDIPFNTKYFKYMNNKKLENTVESIEERYWRLCVDNFLKSHYYKYIKLQKSIDTDTKIITKK